nr:immunoglobulin light chain junction region [Macaca mulatta]MOW52585.1 immunoglobulin light chain junction region [Macaca mulatta]MOW52992.1 immunoglobulin light chain junction region [Macaca mulatta]MOW53233.1 immunoglobulin light chain junction region [Macaca mulatta]MOW53433.1 immunoglobulin light chain junction region [Macaca mulatta]
CQQHSSHPLTF